MLRKIVGILVVCAIIERLHERSWCIAQMEWHRKVARLLDKGESRIDRIVSRIGLGGGGKVNGGFSQWDASFGPSDFIDGVKGGIGNEKCVGIG